jgi:hypothetical protein
MSNTAAECLDFWYQIIKSRSRLYGFTTTCAISAYHQ